jgi:Xaa-Pro aminopeptidase
MSESQFQSFEETGDRSRGRERAEALRAELKRRGLSGFVIPRADDHQNEYVPACAERLAWLTGFSGSAGVAVVLRNEAAIFVDGRYTVQAPSQVDIDVFTPRHIIDEPPASWIAAHLKQGERLGYDPWLHTPEMVERLAKACASAGGELVALESNPLDSVWADRPKPPLGAISLHKKRLAGEAAGAKLKRVQDALNGYDGLVVSDPHNIAWALNIRGADVAYTPLPLCFALVPKAGRPKLFVDSGKLSPSVREALASLTDIAEADTLVGSIEAARGKWLFDGATAPARLTQALRAANGEPVVGADPITLMKAAKNQTELAGARAAHLRDGAAMARFLAWFDAQAPKGKLTEIDACEALESFRRETGALKDISFPSIAGAGLHSAIPHYKVSKKSNLRVSRGIFLIDSGGQYEDGTTDITRTISVGKPTADMRDRFTRVLKGHIAIAQAIFPKGSSGAQIDALARQALWRAGLDFDHGVGHGIGSYLSVHEGPQRIAKTGTVALVPGMIISNEPGYYASGKFGIRIENLVVVENRAIKGAEREMLGFETISFAPIDLRLVDSKLLDAVEIDWLNAYHKQVRQKIAPLVDGPTRAWLMQATRPLLTRD